ncbi:hypothetical protein K8F61_05325 [Microbacterium resistens]|uniref:Uncharacterized protein n=1 Tax=Microbacterium resistens TaxID=156977 RepID=A0ABY3RXY9_9MICO|nr:hypothetical protein [Microbacterium resistens]UGS27611.1 hypothetical protein K8F61_05325 [Microbacterium resistens]
METKPTAFNKSVPPEERNGFFGMEEELIQNAQDAEPIVAIVTYRLDEVVSKALAGETYPVVKTFSIEPLHDEKAIAAAVKLRDAAQKDRTGVEALDLPEVDE